MRNDAGINGDAQRIEQIAWMLFLKVYDTKEQDWEFDDEDYVSIIPEQCRWQNWAYDDKSGSAMTGDTLLNQLEDNVLKYIDVNIIVYNEAATKVRSNAAEQIATNLRAVGINASVEILTRKEVRKAMENGSFDIALVSMNLSEVPDLIPMFSEKGALNYSKVNNETLTQMLRECVYANDETAMKLAYGNIQSYIVENLPVMGICFRTGMVLSGRPMAGMTVSRETDAYSGIEFLVE